MATDKTTVLLVDDDEDFVYQQRVQLEQAGFEVISAQSRVEAEEILEKRRPDVAVVDVMLEQPDAGFVLCHHMRNKDATIPIVLVTAINSQTGMDINLVTDEDRSWIKADAMLSKPIRFEQLLGEIDHLLAVRK
jgi:CheY-like chemotaxis protein